MQGRQPAISFSLWVRFPLKKIKYLIFSFLCSCKWAKRNDEFLNSKRNSFQIPLPFLIFGKLSIYIKGLVLTD